MSSDSFSAKQAITVRTPLIILILILIQRVALVAASAEERAPSQFDQESVKQEKIYGSRGDEVPSGYVTGRGLADYAELLPAGFCDTLGRLRSSDRWLDIGAGEAQAILDYYAPEDDKAPAGSCARPRGQVGAVALSIEDRRTDKWQQQAGSLGAAHTRYV